MTYEPSAAARAAFARTVNETGVTPDFMAVAAAGVSSLGHGLANALAYYEVAEGRTIDIRRLRALIASTATGLAGEFNSQAVRLTRGQQEES